jgi:plastocyanin
MFAVRRRLCGLALVVLAVGTSACGSSGTSGSGLATSTEGATTLPPTAAPATGATATLPVARPTTPIEPSGQRFISVGETGTAYGVDVTVDRVWFDNCAGTLYQAMPGDTILFVQATLTNHTANTTARYGALDWTLEDAAGETYSASITTCHDLEPGPILNPGLTVRKVLGFELSPDVHGLALTWEGLDEPTGDDTIVISLGD